MLATTAIYTATAFNAGFYMLMLTEAHSEEGAAHAFGSVLTAPEDEGGNYTLGEVTERVADEDGDYDLGLPEMCSADETAALHTIAQTARADNLGNHVVLLDSGANG